MTLDLSAPEWFSAMPCKEHVWWCLSLVILFDKLFEHSVGDYQALVVRVKLLLLKVITTSAAQVTERPYWLEHHIHRSGRGGKDFHVQRSRSEIYKKILEHQTYFFFLFCKSKKKIYFCSIVQLAQGACGRSYKWRETFSNVCHVSHELRNFTSHDGQMDTKRST